MKQDNNIIVIKDEFGDYFEEASKRELREIPGVPRYNYVVKEGRVFVFKALLNLYEKALKGPGPKNKTDIALDLLAHAYFSPLNAVKDCGVMPINTEVVKTPEGIKIFHSGLKAYYPKTYGTQEETLDDLAKILIGQVVDGEGDFVYECQKFHGAEIDRTCLLSAMPKIATQRDENLIGYLHLDESSYEEGAAFIDKETYDLICSCERKWAIEKANAIAPFKKITPQFSDQIKRLPASFFTFEELDVDAETLIDVQKLRGEYPELGVLSDKAFARAYERYLIYCNRNDDWQSPRNIDFLKYAVGANFVAEETDYESKIIAHMFLAIWSQHDCIEKAIEQYKLINRYETDLLQTVLKTLSVMQFLKIKKIHPALHGIKITTLNDILGSMRTIPISQS